MNAYENEIKKIKKYNPNFIDNGQIFRLNALKYGKMCVFTSSVNNKSFIIKHIEYKSFCFYGQLYCVTDQKYCLEGNIEWLLHIGNKLKLKILNKEEIKMRKRKK